MQLVSQVLNRSPVICQIHNQSLVCKYSNAKRTQLPCHPTAFEVGLTKGSGGPNCTTNGMSEDRMSKDPYEVLAGGVLNG